MQTVSSQFTQFAKGNVRPHSWRGSISFDKTFDDDVTFFTLDQSVLDGIDLLAPTGDNPLQAWDYYKYIDYSDRFTYMSWDRTLEFPSSVVTARADFELANTDGYFTPNSSSPISSDILPKRPVRLLSGFLGETVPQFVGLTQGMPVITVPSNTAVFTALDFLTQIYDYPIRNTIALRDVRTDQVLENIFQQFGLSEDQYDLAEGSNTIKFLFFEGGQQKAGDVINKLMEAEGGLLWLSEDGIIKFRPRLEISTESVYTFDSSEIVSVQIATDDQIINEVNFNGELREVQDYQSLYLKANGGQVNVIRANSLDIFTAELQDPALNVVTPVLGELAGVSWFVATRPDGTVVGNVTVTATELKTNSFDITFQNNNAFDVDISQLELWGQPAKVYNTVDKRVFYQPSIDKYETKSISIDNNFIQTESQMDSLGLTILDNYAEYASILDVEVKGNPALQLSDIVEFNYENYSGLYRIIGISSRLQDSKYTQNLKLRAYTQRQWFILDQSLLNGTDVLAP